MNYFMGISFSTILIIILIPYIVNILLAIWVYRDAKEYGINNPTLFALLTLIFFEFYWFCNLPSSS